MDKRESEIETKACRIEQYAKEVVTRSSKTPLSRSQNKRRGHNKTESVKQKIAYRHKTTQLGFKTAMHVLTILESTEKKI